MIGTDVVGAGLALPFAVAVGLVAHEWSHALVLRLAHVDYTVSYAPGRRDGLVGVLSSCPWAMVQPLPTGSESPWVLRFAALAPFLLAVPVFGLGLTGGLSTTPVGTAVAIGWLACAIPSPQDFAVAFHAHTALEAATGANAAEYVPRAD